jgi:hypothetical protein
LFSLHAFAEPDQADTAIAALKAHPAVRHIVLGGLAADTGKALISAEVKAESVDQALSSLGGIGEPPSDLSVSRIDVARPATADGVADDAVDTGDALVWTGAGAALAPPRPSRAPPPATMVTTIRSPRGRDALNQRGAQDES